MPRLRLVLADDNQMFREQIRSLIDSQTDMIIAGEAADGRAALQQVRQLQPDVLVLDISMPDINGLQVMEQLKQDGSPVRVLILTIFGEAAYLRHLLTAGAMGYLVKRAAAEELIGAIRAVAAGGTYLDPSLAGELPVTFLDVGRGVSEPLHVAPTDPELTELERDLLRCVARGYSKSEIASQLHISVPTVEICKAHLTTKLSLHSRAQIVRFVIKHGWLEPKAP